MESKTNWEMSLQLAKKDTISSFGTVRFWIFDAFVVGAFTIWVLLWTPNFDKEWYKTVYQVVIPIFGAIAGLLVVFLMTLVVAPYKQRNEARRQVDELKEKQINKLVAKIKAGNPFTEKGRFEDSQRNIHIEDIYAAYVEFYNDSSDLSAQNVWGVIEYCMPNDKIDETLRLLGDWNEATNPDILPHPPNDLRTVELKPKGPPFTMVIALKYPDDEYCYAYNHSNNEFPDLRKPECKLERSKTEVWVSLYGQNVGTFESFGFILNNDGKGHGLHMQRWVNTQEEELFGKLKRYNEPLVNRSGKT